jgi:hypothetical protein
MTTVAVPEHVLYGMIVEYELSGRCIEASAVRELARAAGIAIVEAIIDSIKSDVRGVTRLHRPVFSVN